MTPPLKEMRHRSIRRWLQDAHPAGAPSEDEVRRIDEAMMEAFDTMEEASMNRLMKAETWGTEEGYQQHMTDRLMAWGRILEEYLPTIAPDS